MADDVWHSQQYAAALRQAGVTTAPEWDDLEPETKDRIRHINLEHQKYMDDLGKSIANGTLPPMPPILRDRKGGSLT